MRIVNQESFRRLCCEYSRLFVKNRAKGASRFLNKLQQRGIADTIQLEHERKDLASGHIAFSTSSNIVEHIDSSIIYVNFDVLEVKLHKVWRKIEDAADLYISN